MSIYPKKDMEQQALNEPEKQRIHWVDYLRSLNIIATVIFHSFLAYSPVLKNQDLDLVSSFPLVDPITSLRIADLLLILRPLFSMPLMFYLSGLFVWRGIERRGLPGYLQYRFMRLVIPLILAGLIVMPLTYMPMAILGNGGAFPNTAKEIIPIIFSVVYKLGHLWFLWVLFVFDCIALIIYKTMKTWLESKLIFIDNRAVYSVLVIVVLTVYELMADIGGQWGWVRIGLFDIPASRIGLYFVYFLLGVIMGSQALSEDAKQFNVFCILASGRPAINVGVSAFLASASLLYMQFNFQKVAALLGADPAKILCNGLYALSGLLLTISVILIAKKHLASERKWLNLLNMDSYGIYVTHYLFVAWIQYLLVYNAMPGGCKPLLAAVFSILLSWLTSAGIRRSIGYLYNLRAA